MERRTLLPSTPASTFPRPTVPPEHNDFRVTKATDPWKPPPIASCRKWYTMSATWGKLEARRGVSSAGRTSSTVLTGTVFRRAGSVLIGSLQFQSSHINPHPPPPIIIILIMCSELKNKFKVYVCIIHKHTHTHTHNQHKTHSLTHTHT